MDKKNVEEKVIEILADRLSKKIEEIKPSSRLIEDLEIDSFSSIEIMFALDDKFNIKTAEKDLATIKTVSEIVNLVVSKISSVDK